MPSIFSKPKGALKLIPAIFILATVYACSHPKTFVLTCQERQIEIYVDDQYLGRDMVRYTVPKGRDYINVSCRENGVEVYHKSIYVANRDGNLIELQIPKNYRYSSKPF